MTALTTTSRISKLITEQTVAILNVIYQGAARNAASVHFRSRFTRTDILVDLLTASMLRTGSRALMRRAWFMCSFRRYINRLLVYLLNFLRFFFLRYFLFSLCFLSYLFTSLHVYFLTISSFRIDPFRFQAGGRMRRPNLVLFLGFILCCSI